MNNEQFESAVMAHLNKIETNLIAKAAEYAIEGDRLHNFNRGAGITGDCREKVLFGFALKHLISIMDIIDNINDKNKIPTQVMLDEKLGDMGTYIAILHASIQERIDNP
jgi:hypothetical protein